MATPEIQVLIDWNNDGDFLDANEDASTDVREIALDHIRDMQTDYMNGAVMDFVLNNATHKYSPPNGASPLTGSLKPGRIVWARAFYPYDTFAGGVGTILSSHTPDRDGSWSWAAGGQPPYQYLLSGTGAAVTQQVTGSYLNYMDFNDTDVSVAIQYKRGTNVSTHGGLLLRYADDSNHAQLVVTGTALELRKTIGGVNSLVGSGAQGWATGVTGFLHCVMHGTSFRAFAGTAAIIDTTLTNATLNTATAHGIFCQGTADHEWNFFGGYRSLFTGKLSRIRPRPAEGAKYCYMQAIDAYEQMKNAQVNYDNIRDIGGDETYKTLSQLFFSVTNYAGATLFDAGTVLVQDAVGQTGTNRTGYKPINMDLLSACYRFQDEEDGFYYIDNQGYHRLEGRYHRAAAPHNASVGTFRDVATGTDPAFTREGFSWDDGTEGVENSITITVRRGSVTASATLWSLDQSTGTLVSIPFDASGSKIFLAEVTDYDGVIGWIAPSATLDYNANTSADNSGTNINSEVNLLAHNPNPPYYRGNHYLHRLLSTGTTDGFLTKFQLRGTAYTLGDPVSYQQVDATSQTAYGERSKIIDCLWIDREDAANALGTTRLARKKDPKSLIEMSLKGVDKVTMHNMIQRNISDRISVVYGSMGITADYFIEGESWRIFEGGTDVQRLLQIREV